MPRFRAGQFLHLALDPYDPTGFWPESRVFSIASPPAQRDSVRITYAVHGQFTARMESDLAEGRQVWIKMPYGDFVIESQADVVLFAGGTGVTAFTAFLEDLPRGDTAVGDARLWRPHGAAADLPRRRRALRCPRAGARSDLLRRDDGDAVAEPIEERVRWSPGRVSVTRCGHACARPLETSSTFPVRR